MCVEPSAHKEVVGAEAETSQQASTNPHGGNKGKGRASGEYSVAIRFVGTRPDIAEKNIANSRHSLRSGVTTQTDLGMPFQQVSLMFMGNTICLTQCVSAGNSNLHKHQPGLTTSNLGSECDGPSVVETTKPKPRIKKKGEGNVSTLRNHCLIELQRHSYCRCRARHRHHTDRHRYDQQYKGGIPKAQGCPQCRGNKSFTDRNSHSSKTCCKW